MPTPIENCMEKCYGPFPGQRGPLAERGIHEIRASLGQAVKAAARSIPLRRASSIF
jgi:hypothetical protein